LNKVFVSTDAEIEEYRELNEELSELGFQVSRFSNNTLSEGAISIVDQVILTLISNNEFLVDLLSFSLFYWYSCFNFFLSNSRRQRNPWFLSKNDVQ
jgi:hypothetical protein